MLVAPASWPNPYFYGRSKGPALPCGVSTDGRQAILKVTGRKRLQTVRAMRRP